MSQKNPIRLFVTHSWEGSDDYSRVFEYLESARNFFYRNTGTPDHPPMEGADQAREDLRQQIGLAEVVIALASLQAKQPDLLVFQLNYAKAVKCPVVLLPPFGSQQPLPKLLTERADEVVGWEERGLVDAIRRLARHENTARFDVIDFSPEDFKLD